MIHPLRLGIAGGIIWGLCLFVCTVISIYTGYAAPFLTIMGSVYPGYIISWPGSIIGFVYGFIDAFIGLWLLALLYNALGQKDKPKRRK